MDVKYCVHSQLAGVCGRGRSQRWRAWFGCWAAWAARLWEFWRSPSGFGDLERREGVRVRGERVDRSTKKRGREGARGKTQEGTGGDEGTRTPGGDTAAGLVS